MTDAIGRDSHSDIGWCVKVADSHDCEVICHVELNLDWNLRHVNKALIDIALHEDVSTRKVGRDCHLIIGFFDR